MLPPLRKQEASTDSGRAPRGYRHGLLLILICYLTITKFSSRGAVTTIEVTTKTLTPRKDTATSTALDVITKALTARKDTSTSAPEGSTITNAASTIAKDWELRQALGDLYFGPSDPCKNETKEFCKKKKSCKTGYHDLWLATPDAQPVLPGAPASPDNNDTTTVGCKTLWFAGMSLGSNSQCTTNGGGYQMEYAMALASARINAIDSLQPVLLLSTYGLEGVTTPAEDHALAKWARSQGAIVIVIDRLSFQDTANELAKGFGPEHAVGPYLRMDIPRIIQQANLFDLPNVCPRHVMYTDSDVLFANRITIEDMTVLKSYIAPDKPAYLMYGREGDIDALQPENTGVFVMDVHRWEQEWEDILSFGMNKTGGFPAFDQGWINEYFRQSYQDQQKVAMLPLAWNWKAYWGLQPTQWTDVKILHFHGPKPDRGLWEMASCSAGNLTNVPEPYWYFVKQGICCNNGSVAHYARKIYDLLLPHAENVCSHGPGLSS